VKPEQWKVTFAPPPDDLYWENLSMSRYEAPKVSIILNKNLVLELTFQKLNQFRRYLSLKKVFVNIALFLVTFFLTTPEYLVSQTNNIVPLIANGLELPSW
jgi:hypothetical protein